jgi:hypothetical protein
MISSSAALACGIFAHSIFVGGNIMVSFVIVPTILSSFVPPRVQLQQWNKTYHIASRIMVAMTLISTISYAIAAYVAPTKAVQNAALLSTAFAISPFPVTGFFILPHNKHLKELLKRDKVEEIQEETEPLIIKWNQLSAVRTVVSTIGFINGLMILAGFYH